VTAQQMIVLDAPLALGVAVNGFRVHVG
jgi:hypothetical protein